MLIVIDKTNLRMVGAAPNRKWAQLIVYVDFCNVDTAIVDSEEGRTWTVLDKAQMATLFTNMSGMEAPPYSEAIEQLRQYSTTWENYPKAEAALEKEAEAIYQEEQAERGDVHYEAERKQEADDCMRHAHQATIQMAEAAHANPPAPSADAAQEAPTKPKAAPRPASEGTRPAQGITKKIWEIADELLAVTGSVGNVKEFRSKVIERAVAMGANSGTAATQFGHWKRSKGIS